VCLRGSVSDYIADPASVSGKLFGSARGHGFTRQSTEAEIKIWRSAAAPIDGRLKETGVMFGVAAKEDRSRKMANRRRKKRELHSEYMRQIARLNILPPFIQIQA